MIDGKCKILKVYRDEILFENNGKEYGSMITPIIYEYVPGESIQLIDGDFLHKEDIQRINKLTELIGIEFETFKDMIEACGDEL